MQKPIQVGLPIPSFAVKDAKGNEITSKKLHGTFYVLYFYPKNEAPGCSQEACSFRDHKPDFDRLNVPVFGVSSDTSESHVKFGEMYQLNFILIPDTDHLLSELFGVLVPKKHEDKTRIGIERTTFIIDEHGILRWMERPVKIEGHVERVLQALKQLSAQTV